MINTKEIEYIAQLTNLEIDEADIQELTGQIKVILEYINILGEIEANNISASTLTSLVRNVFREDELKSSMGREKALANAPEREEDLFKVPKIMGE